MSGSVVPVTVAVGACDPVGVDAVRSSCACVRASDAGVAPFRPVDAVDAVRAEHLGAVEVVLASVGRVIAVARHDVVTVGISARLPAS